MPRTNYQRGADKERRIVNYFKKKGCIALRSAGSHSIIDVVVIDIDNRTIRLIQSKLNKISKPAEHKIITEGLGLNGNYRVEFQLWGKYAAQTR